MRRALGVFIVGFALLLFVLVLTCRKLAESRSEVVRLKANQEELMRGEQQLKAVKTLTGDTAVEVRRLTLEADELRDMNNRLTSDIQNLRVRLRDVQSAERTVTRTEYKFVPETVRVRDVVTLHFSDAWMEMTADTAGVRISSHDTLTVVRHQERRRFLFWVRKKDKYVTVHNANPHTEITTIESIDIEK